MLPKLRSSSPLNDMEDWARADGATHTPTMMQIASVEALTRRLRHSGSDPPA